MFSVISMLILPQLTQNNSFNVFIWASLFVGLGMQMCLYSIEWYARLNCPRFVVNKNFEKIKFENFFI
jgi:sterol O-acyltransferase